MEGRWPTLRTTHRQAGGSTLLDLAVVAFMLALGLLLGFVGIGGAGFITGSLIMFFHVPVHLAFGTGLGAMFISAGVGGSSHFRRLDSVWHGACFLRPFRP